jgi:hypothetical protein
VLVLAGAFIAASMALGGMIALLIAAPAILLGPLALILALPIALMGVVVAAAAAFVAFRVWTDGAKGITTFFSNVVLVVESIVDALQHWEGATYAISEAHAAALEKSGVMKYFTTTISYIRRAEVAFTEFQRIVNYHGDAIYNHLSVAWERFGAAVNHLLDALGFVRGSLDDATHAGNDWGETFARVVEAIVDGVIWIMNAFSDLVPSQKAGVLLIADMSDAWAGTKHAVRGFYDFTMFAIDGVLAGLNLVILALNQISELFSGHWGFERSRATSELLAGNLRGMRDHSAAAGDEQYRIDMQYGEKLRAKYGVPAPENPPSWAGNGAMKAPAAPPPTYIPPSSIAASKGYYDESVEAQRKMQDLYVGMGSVGSSAPPTQPRTMNLTMMLNGKVLGEAVADILEENKASAGIHPIFESVDRVGDWR